MSILGVLEITECDMDRIPAANSPTRPVIIVCTSSHSQQHSTYIATYPDKEKL